MRCVIHASRKKLVKLLSRSEAPSLLISIWVFYLRPYTPEPLHYFRCQQFVHHQNNCFCNPACGICSGKHLPQQCLRQIQCKARGDTQVSQLWERTPCVESQLPCPPTAYYAGPRAADVVGPGPTKNRHGPRSSRNFRLGTTETSHGNSSANPAAKGFPSVVGVDTAITTAANTAGADTQPSLISNVCFSYTSVTTPATTLSSTGHLSHDTRASSRFCHGTNYVSGHCFHPDLGGCSRHVSLRSRIADRVVKQLMKKAQALVATPLQQPAPLAPPRAPRRLSATNSHPPTPSPGRSVALSITSDGRGQLRLCQWNCRGFRSQYTSLLEMARQDTVDIVLLQKTLLPEGSTTTLPGY